MSNLKTMVSDVLADFNLDAPTEERAQIGIWVPKTYKAKYDNIQDRSNKEFSKVLQKLIMKALDQVEV